MKTRLKTGIDTKTWEPFWAVQVHDGTGWKYRVEDGKLCLFAEKEKAEALRADMRRKSAFAAHKS